VPRHQQELPGDVVEGGRLAEGARVLGVERLRHVQPVEPHLLRVDLLVPEAALGRARLRAELRAQRVERPPVARLLGALVQAEEQAALRDLVEVELRDVVALDRPVGLHEAVHVRLDVGEHGRIAARQRHPLDRAEDHAGRVVPPPVRLRIALHHRLDHPQRHRAGADRRAARRGVRDRQRGVVGLGSPLAELDRGRQVLHLRVRRRRDGRQRQPGGERSDGGLDACHALTTRPFIVRLRSVSACTPSVTFPFSTPSKRQSTIRTSEISDFG
jgi:hypothetical protein